MVLICAIPSKDNVQDLEATKQTYTNLMGQTKGAPLKYYMMSKTGEKHICIVYTGFKHKIEQYNKWKRKRKEIVGY